ncbi:MAG: hybrid sensor histidine kinase/response regulator [Telluria sp.]
MSQDEDLGRYSMLDLFRMEADGQARTLTEGLLALERDAGAPVEPLMRAAHSLKGAAAIVGLDPLVQLAHGLEDAFLTAQGAAAPLAAGQIDTMLAAVDLLRQAAGQDDAALDAWLLAQTPQLLDLLARLRAPADGGPVKGDPVIPAHAGTPAPALRPQPEPAPAPEPPAPEAPHAPTRAAADHLLTLASQARIAARQLQPLIDGARRLQRQHAQLLAALGELAATPSGAIAPERLRAALAGAAPLRAGLHAHTDALEQFERRQARVAGGLLDEVLALRMRPFGDGVHAFPRMVRDLARRLGKEARLELDGAATPVDRAVLAAIESPLNHLLRNALDHGLEPPDERRAAGKPPAGVVRLQARHRAGLLAITVSDDGRGVDLEAIRNKVVARGLAQSEMAARLTPAELLEFLLLPAFTLRDTATELSGRGVGLDLVAEAVRAQQGTLRLAATPGQGFTAELTLPLTRSLVRALVFDVGGEAYALPLAQAERVLAVPRAAVRELEAKPYVDDHGALLGLVSAAQVLEVPAADAGGDTLAAVVVGSGARRYALVVDRVRGEANLVVQPLDTLFGKLRDVAAASVLDDGSPLLILDLPDLLLSIDKLLHGGALAPLPTAAAASSAPARRVLVVDDSLTVREMERQLLAARGYAVDVAVDGMDGWNAVRAGHYDLVVTDIDMPRLDGIELVHLIRADARLHGLPVMIVSYKDRPEDRARGLDAGADYYLAKGAFHDSSLLDAVTELIGAAR